MDRLSDLAPESAIDYGEVLAASLTASIEHEFLKPLLDLTEKEMMRYAEWTTWG